MSDPTSFLMAPLIAREVTFRKWYTDHARQLKLDPDPDNPLHFYDWRAAWAAGAEPDSAGHWPSEFKRQGHPRAIIREGGKLIDTRTTKPTTVADSLHNARARG